MTKQIVEPMFASMLPAPLNSLHFAKIDLGPVPLKLGNVDVHKMENGAIKMDLDVDWDGQCDIELDGGAMVPKIGIEHVKLSGRLSILLGPLTNVIPLVSYSVSYFSRMWLASPDAYRRSELPRLPLSTRRSSSSHTRTAPRLPTWALSTARSARL